MADEVAVRDEEERDTRFDPERGGLPQEDARLVVPELDGEGGTTFVYGGTDEEASKEEWAEQNGTPAPTEDDLVEEDDE